MNNKDTKKEMARMDLNIEKWQVFTTRKYKTNSRELIKKVMLPDGGKEEIKLIIALR